MSWEIAYTDHAQNDLRSIIEYIAYTCMEQQIALDLARKITAQIQLLSELPMRYPLYGKKPWKDLRYFPVQRYLVFYRVDAASHTVVVVRIFYGGRDIAAALREN